MASRGRATLVYGQHEEVTMGWGVQPWPIDDAWMTRGTAPRPRSRAVQEEK